MKVKITIIADMTGLPRDQLEEIAGDEVKALMEETVEGGDFTVEGDDDKEYIVEFSVQAVQIESL